MEETEISLQDILKVLKRRARFIISITIICGLVALGVGLLTPPTYEAETTLRIKQSKGLNDSLLASLPVASSVATNQQLSTYAEILKSRTIVEKVISQTQTDKPKLPTYNQFVGNISVSPVKDTEILRVKVKETSPEKAQEVTDVLVNEFIERMIFLTRSEQKAVREFIANRLTEAESELDKAETALERYKSSEKILAPEAETKAILDKLAVIDKLTAENSIALGAAQAKLNTVEQQLGEQKPGFIAESPLIQQYKSKLANLQIELVGLLQKYTENHPQVLEVQASIEEAKTNLDAEVSRIVNAEAASTNPVHQELLKSKIIAEGEIAARAAQRGAIQEVLADGEEQLIKLPAKEQGFAKVMRDVSVAQDIFTMLAKRHEEARISEVMTPTNIQIIDKATLPDKPIAPRVKLNAIIGLMLGLMLSIFLAFILEMMNRTIETREDVTEFLNLPVLGNIPIFEDNNRKNGKKGKLLL